mmetsp:Transcript_3070/g.10615  ORF Transcript_3070/g.10615 Transcript_3070/m.10615 type:complete len:231 (+) Transcript_3070:392-1084(+)
MTERSLKGGGEGTPPAPSPRPTRQSSAADQSSSSSSSSSASAHTLPSDRFSSEKKASPSASALAPAAAVRGVRTSRARCTPSLRRMHALTDVALRGSDPPVMPTAAAPHAQPYTSPRCTSRDPHQPKRKPAAKASPQPVVSLTALSWFGWNHHCCSVAATAPSGPSVTTTSGAPRACKRRTASEISYHVARRPAMATPAMEAASRWLQSSTSVCGSSSRSPPSQAPVASV